MRPVPTALCQVLAVAAVVWSTVPAMTMQATPRTPKPIQTVPTVIQPMPVLPMPALPMLPNPMIKIPKPVVPAIAMNAASPATGQNRLALVIGNDTYRNMPPLKNARNDAELMAATLDRLGFRVTMVTNADQKAMKKALKKFSRKLRATESIGLFYYSGHGLQVKGENYLVPVTADIADETEVGIEGVSVNDFLATMERSGNRINIVILDACRNNPYASSFRSATRGLAPVRAPGGTFIAYSTAPGNVAQDGDDGNSPYTKALTAAMVRPGLSIEKVFKIARLEVQKLTGHKQTPWETSSITEDFSFTTGSTRSAPPQQIIAPPPQQTIRSASNTQSLELAFWNSIKDSASPATFKAYLKQYPNGTFRALAQIRVAELSAPTTTAPTATAPATRGNGSAKRLAMFNAVLPHSTRQIVRPKDLAPLDCLSLWRARNEIYHRRGYCFRSEKGMRHFDNAGCTVSEASRVPLTILEKRNIKTIRNWESRKRCR